MAPAPPAVLDDDFTALLAPLARRRPGADTLSPGTRSRVLARVQASVAAHTEYRTVRREDSPWLPQGEGVHVRTLRADEEARVDMWALDAGTELPWPEGVCAQEILVVEGRLSDAGEAAVDVAVPTAGVADSTAPGSGCVHHVRFAGDATLLRADVPTRAYVRQLLVSPQKLPPLEARWWASGGSRRVSAAGRRWRRAGEGVEVLPLRGDAEVISMLVRFAAGASVADHRHGLDEDCLVLAGEMFLGDILLRAGDYQLAPAGGGHFGECSDVGALFFFHGALDPVLRGQAPPQPVLPR